MATFPSDRSDLRREVAHIARSLGVPARERGFPRFPAIGTASASTLASAVKWFAADRKGKYHASLCFASELGRVDGRRAVLHRRADRRLVAGRAVRMKREPRKVTAMTESLRIGAASFAATAALILTTLGGFNPIG
jgi:hypothetical protein